VTVITLADGRKFDTVKKIAIEDISPDADDVSGDLPIPAPKGNPRLEDLPAAPKVMNATIAVAGYKILGLPNRDICEALGCSLQQLDDILNGEIYKITHDKMIESFVNGQQQSAKDILANGAIMAAKEVIKIAKNSKNEANRLKAAESVLNRNNIVGEESNGMGGGLTIKIINDKKSDSITISM
jgi:hypothetical protein